MIHELLPFKFFRDKKSAQTKAKFWRKHGKKVHVCPAGKDPRSIGFRWVIKIVGNRKRKV